MSSEPSPLLWTAHLDAFRDCAVFLDSLGYLDEIAKHLLAQKTLELLEACSFGVSHSSEEDDPIPYDVAIPCARKEAMPKEGW